MSLPANLASVVSALQAQVNGLLSTVGAQQTAINNLQQGLSEATTTATAGLSLHDLSGGPLVLASASTAGAVAPTLLDLSPYIPASATFAMIRVFGRVDDASVIAAQIYFQSTSGGTLWPTWRGRSSGTDSDIEGNAGGTWLVPVSNQGLYYSVDAHIQQWEIDLWGYYG